ncbi:unannotated protein [freshwater metagenome]|uniref:Unannotated protein n=1 Tax=freshwater metagenome TaxID=449393 RepID=A0A6J7EG95_9ZZZZ
MVVPTVRPEELIHRQVEILVMGELHVAANIPREPLIVDER